MFDELVLRGASLRECSAAIRKRFKSWGLGDDQIREGFMAALATLAATRSEAAVETPRAIARLHQLYGKASTVQDFKTALAVQKEINGLLSLRRAQPDARIQEMLREL